MFGLLGNLALFDKLFQILFQSLPIEHLLDSVVSGQLPRIAPHCTGMQSSDKFGLQSRVAAYPDSILVSNKTIM